MNIPIFAALLAAVPIVAAAESPGVRPMMAEGIFSNDAPALSVQERASVAMAKKWRTGSATGSKPLRGPDGAIRFVFGAQQPSVVCAVLQLCDIELQVGERVNSIHVGDTVRWTVEPAITGVAPNEVQHLIIKPIDTGLETSMVVTTNKRTYHLNLRSHRTEFMPRVAFTYADEIQAKWDAIKSREIKQRQEKTIAQTGEYLGDLSFAYDVAGAAPWKPVRVYNNGSKTIIQMPAAMAQTEAPTLLVVRRDGTLLTDPETVMVNYRIQGDRYIVDTVFDKAILIAGVGSGQDRVTITRGKP